MTATKGGVSAQALQRTLSLGSYQTAWSMLHRFRTAMAEPTTGKLSGVVEVDETLIGGVKPGLRGRAPGGKVVVAVAVEHRPEGHGFGRCRMEVVPNAKAVTMRPFIYENIEVGSTIITDGLRTYQTVLRGNQDFEHRRFVQSREQPGHVVLPGVHRVASLTKRWLLGVHHGAVEEEHLQEYLNEFKFRFNRRSSNQRGMLFFRLMEAAVATPPTTFRELVRVPQPAANRKLEKNRKVTPPTTRRVAADTLAKRRRRQPWLTEQPP